MATIQHNREPGSPLSRRVKANLKTIAEIRDDQIDTSDIPELTAEDFAQALPNPYLRPAVRNRHLRYPKL